MSSKKEVTQNKDIRNLNNIGKRIAWCRDKLGLKITETRKGVKMPRSSYTDRESGARARYIEEYLVLARFFNSKWKEKFNQSFPSYAGEEITQIKVSWLMFGVMDE
jgi:hypothetical protein